MVAVLLLVGALLAIGLKLGSSNEHSELCSWPKYKQMPEVTTERDESILLQSRIQSNRNSGESQAPKDDAALRQVSMSRNASNAKVDGSRKRNSTSPRRVIQNSHFAPKSSAWLERIGGDGERGSRACTQKRNRM